MTNDISLNKKDLVDTHCHLDMDAFDPDRDEVIRRAKDAGVGALITIGSDLKGNIGGLNSHEDMTSYTHRSGSILMMQRILQRRYSIR